MAESPTGAQRRESREAPTARRGTADEARQREKIQRQLDEALADSFPASDPVSIVTSNEEEDWGEPGALSKDDQAKEGDSRRGAGK